MTEVVASTDLLCVRPDGESVRVSAALGRPYQTSAGDWACPVALSGIHDSLSDAHGVDSLQALCLAATLLRELLARELERGCKLLYQNGGEEFPLDATFSAVGGSKDSV